MDSRSIDAKQHQRYESVLMSASAKEFNFEKLNDLLKLRNAIAEELLENPDNAVLCHSFDQTSIQIQQFFRIDYLNNL